MSEDEGSLERGEREYIRGRPVSLVWMVFGGFFSFMELTYLTLGNRCLRTNVSRETIFEDFCFSVVWWWSSWCVCSFFLFSSILWLESNTWTDLAREQLVFLGGITAEVGEWLFWFWLF